MDDLLRVSALTAAIETHKAAGLLPLEPGVDARTTYARNTYLIRLTAETFLAWLHGTTRITIHAGTVRDQTTGQPTGTPTSSKGSMQLHDNEQFDLAVDTKDAKGFETADAVNWSVDVDGVVTLDISEDGRTVTVKAVAPGSCVVTVEDTEASLSATEAIDVVTGDTALISVVEGPVTVQA